MALVRCRDVPRRSKSKSCIPTERQKLTVYEKSEKVRGLGHGIQINGSTRFGSTAAIATRGHIRIKTHGDGDTGNRRRRRIEDSARGMVQGGTGRVVNIGTTLVVVIKVDKTTCHSQIVEWTHNVRLALTES
jgi:hypothetical protein